jgi:hypothetical protein
MSARLGLVLLLFFACRMDAQTNALTDIRTAILTIEKPIGDLTDQTTLLRCEPFLTFRKSITEAKATGIVRLIRSKELQGDAASIGILAAQFLPEERFWAVTMPLLSVHTEEVVLRDILMPALPYGPGYAHSITNEIYKDKLITLKNDPGLSSSLQDTIDFILKGESAKMYSRFKRDPHRFNYNREFLVPEK